MMTRLIYLTYVLFVMVSAIGCGGAVMEETITVQAANDPLNEPRSILQRYADGQAIGSEVSTFADMVARVEKVDPDRAAILRDGLTEIEAAAPSARASLAKTLLEKLQPSMQ
jgi:hypothetical protein